MLRGNIHGVLSGSGYAAGVLDDRNIRRTELAFFWIILNVKRDLLTLVQRFVSLRRDGRKMDKQILAAVIVRNKAITFVAIKPFDSTVVHKIASDYIMTVNRIKNFVYICKMHEIDDGITYKKYAAVCTK